MHLCHRGVAFKESGAGLDVRPFLAGYIAWSKLQTRCQLLSPGSAQQPSVALRQAGKAFASLLTALGEHIGVGTYNNTIGSWFAKQTACLVQVACNSLLESYFVAPKALLLSQFNRPASPPLPVVCCCKCARMSSMLPYLRGSFACLLQEATAETLCSLCLYTQQVYDLDVIACGQCNQC